MFTVLAMKDKTSNGDVVGGLLLDATLLIFLMVFLGLGDGVALFAAATLLTAILR